MKTQWWRCTVVCRLWYSNFIRIGAFHTVREREESQEVNKLHMSGEDELCEISDRPFPALGGQWTAAGRGHSGQPSGKRRSSCLLRCLELVQSIPGREISSLVWARPFCDVEASDSSLLLWATRHHTSVSSPDKKSLAHKGFHLPGVSRCSVCYVSQRKVLMANLKGTGDSGQRWMDTEIK